MSINPAGAVPVTLTIFGSWCTEMTPESVPEGVSPDNRDVVFSPGQVNGRPALEKGFTFPGNPTVVGGKSFVTPTGVVKNLFYCSDGNLYVEDFTNSPGTFTTLFTSTPGTFYKSITEFGREWISLSDGLHGTEVPLQYDGTNLDRVTQDGPAVAPLVANIALPPRTLTTPPVVSGTIVNIVALVFHGGYYSNVVMQMTAPVAFVPGEPITISGTSNSAMNTTFILIGPSHVFGAGYYEIDYYDTVNPSSTGGTATSSSTSTLRRISNIVSGNTTAAHGLQVGYLAKISNVPTTAVGGGISSIVIKNEDSPGLATVTTASAHGLTPGNIVTLTGITPVAVGGGVTAIAIVPGTVTLTTASAHNLNLGSVVDVAGTTASDGQWVVSAIPSTTKFSYSTLDTTASSGAVTATASLVFPNLGLNEQQFTVVESPSDTTFTVGLTYSDGTWTSGAVSFAWDGTFFITAVPSTTSFQYQQYGPDAVTTTTGTITPTGQAAPGKHQVRYSFLTRQGAITKPSPAATFIANGGEYLGVSNISPGPPNVIARIVQFTGALGSKFYYIPVPAQVNGQVVSTATQIQDNVTTSAVFDFSDNTLFAGLATDIPGNNLPAQIILDGALGFGSYGSRLLTYGQRNTVQNLLAMSFDAGPNPTGFAGPPNGWIRTNSDVSGLIVTANVLNGWQINITNDSVPRGTLWQSAYQDSFSVPVVTINTKYTFRAWFQPVAATASDTFKVTISSAATSFTSTATIALSAMSTAGSFIQANFDTIMPTIIPADMLLTISASGTVATALVVDDMSLIYQDSPYLDGIIFGSYVDNAEGLDGLTGKFGPSEDTRKVMDFGVLRSNLYMLTRDPSGRLHETSDNGTTEPAGWTINEVASNCGALSAFCVTKSQADDGSTSGGEEWLAWASESGARIFGGDNPYKISQELQPNWFDAERDAAVQINMSAALTIFVMNDPVQRVIYFGLPIGSSTAPSLIYPLNYRELDTAYAIANSPPYHPSLGGRLIATDNTRKWTRWNMTMNGMARMYRGSNSLSTVFFGGNGHTINTQAGFGNFYTLNPAMFTDDDYGLISPYYVTYFSPSSDEAQQLQLDQGRKMLSYLSAYAGAVGNLNIQIFCDRLGNPWNLTCTRQPGVSPNFDLEWGGGQAQAQRMAFKISSTPLTDQTDNTFSLSILTAWFKKARMLVRGSAT